jgi:hypothetical protein
VPKATKATTPVVLDLEMAEDRACELEDITVNFTTIREDQDLAPMLAVLPDGVCRCPHWGVVSKGRLTVTYSDREEVYEAGDAFYMTPGHTPAAIAGTEFVMFSPTDLYAATDAAITKGLEQAAAQAS